MVAYELDGSETARIRIVRLLANSLKRVWLVNIPAFNLSAGVIEGRFLYQPAFGFVSKIDLQRDDFVWKHQGLYESPRQAFNSFQQPIVQSEEVIFGAPKVPGEIRIHFGRDKSG